MNKNKPIILLNIDSLMTKPLELAIKKHKAPALEFLMQNGDFVPNMVSSFPTMSVTIDSSLLTGTYSDQHHVPGLNWFDVRNSQKVNYGTGFRETIGVGFSDSILNMFNRLNNYDLSQNVSTIFEDLNKNHLTSASINSFVYRGSSTQNLNVPKFVQAITSVNHSITTKTPDLISLGAFSRLRNQGFAPFMIGGNRKYAGRELRYLIKQNLLPDFTFCIFQDMDIRVHIKGPYDISGIKKIDKEIQKTLNLYSSWTEAIKRNTWIVIGDNGQSRTGWKMNQALIDLRKVFSDYQVHNIKYQVEQRDQLVISVNQRMAYIYVLDESLNLEDVARKAQSDNRTDVVAWKADNQVNVISGMKDGRLKYRRHGKYVDNYQQQWTIEGNLDILDLSIENDFVLYGDYPDALARIYGALYSHEGRFIIVNAKPGCEFQAQKTPFHLGGACHGSLHKYDSLIPFIISGAEEKLSPLRIIELKKLIMNLLTTDDKHLGQI